MTPLENMQACLDILKEHRKSAAVLRGVLDAANSCYVLRLPYDYRTQRETICLSTICEHLGTLPRLIAELEKDIEREKTNPARCEVEACAEPSITHPSDPWALCAKHKEEAEKR